MNGNATGTGKSVLLREIIKTLRKKFVKTPDAIAITASTGTCSVSVSFSVPFNIEDRHCGV